MWIIIFGAVIAAGATAAALVLRERRMVEDELGELRGDGFDRVRANYDRAMDARMWQAPRPVVVRTTHDDHRVAA